MIIDVSMRWNLRINGENRSVPAVQNVEQLLSTLGISPDRVAVELNRRVLRKREWSDTRVRDGDRVEIVQFVGGG